MAEATRDFQRTVPAPHGGGPLTIRSVNSTLAQVHSTAAVSNRALIGAPGEWRDKPSVFPAIVREDATIREFARVHAGCQRETVIGARTLMMAGSHVGHDAQLGEGCELAPNAVVGGCCTLGARVRVGMNASILPHVTIGDGARIGAGAVVTKDVPAGEIWVGAPARRIR